MRTVPLVLLAVAALVAPVRVLAGGPPTTARSFVISGIVVGGQTTEVTGKLAIADGRLSASVGCNLIGGTVTIDGDTVTVTQPLVMTEMACPGMGDAESALIKALQHGPFQVTARAWIGDGAQILVEELVVPAPDPNATAVPPDEPVTSSPDAVIVEPAMSCSPIQVDAGVGGSGGGSTGSGGTSTGAGEAVGGSSGSGGENPSATAIAEPGMTSDPNVVPPAPPLPGTEPAGTAPAATRAPDGPTPIAPNPCGSVGYVDDGTTAGGAPAEAPEIGADAAAHAKSGQLDAALAVPILVVVLAGIAIASGALVARRRRATRPGTGVDASR